MISQAFGQTDKSLFDHVDSLLTYSLNYKFDSSLIEEKSLNYHRQSLSANTRPLLILDGKPIELVDLKVIKWEKVASIEVWKGEDPKSGALYGLRGIKGVVIITTQRFQRRTKRQ